VIAYTLISGRFERVQLRKSAQDPRGRPHLETCP